MSYLDRIAECNTADLSHYRPFYIAGQRVGWIGETMAQHIAPHADVFRVTVDAVHLNPDLDTFDARSAAVENILRQLQDDGIVAGWRDEPYPVATGFAVPPLMKMERAAIPLFGIRAYGVHVNGFVRRPSGLDMWIGRRTRDKATFPGMLDNMVAGGQPLGIGLMENLIKEAAEEASVPERLARTARPVGAITYTAADGNAIKPDVQFCYDLEVPAGFTPENTDGEIDTFFLWPAERVLEIVAETGDFKFNCNLVIIDFAVRHGLIPPDHPDYVAICQGLRH